MHSVTGQASFARNHDLTRHYTGHDKIKAHRCNGCDRSFTRKDALKRHSQTKDCGDAQNGEPVGWLKRKAAKKAREMNQEREPEEEEVVLSMPPPRPAPAGRNHLASGSGSRHPPAIFPSSRTSIREASAPYPTTSVSSHPRELPPVPEVLGIHHHSTRSSASRSAARYPAHQVPETPIQSPTLPARGDPVSTPVHVRLPVVSDQQHHQLLTGRAPPADNSYASLSAQAHRLRSSGQSFDAGPPPYAAGIAPSATTTAATQDYEYRNSYGTDSAASALSLWNNASHHQYHSR